jgi:4-hydroxy-3-methylbut-2-enyl diphosphate reductase
VKALAKQAEVILVVGAENSSNSNRLVEVAHGAGVHAYLIATAAEIRPEWLDGCRHVGVTAGASTPEILVQQVVDELKKRGFSTTEEIELIEVNVHFPLPTPLESLEPVVP